MRQFAIDPRGRQYHSSNAYWLGRAAQLAYEDKANIEQEVAGWGLDDFQFFSANGTQAFLAANDDVILVAFRGTEVGEFEDWMTDLNANLVGGPAGKVHEGFQIALSAVWGEVYQAIVERREAQRKQTLWFTGHSLGAGLATLAVAKLRIERDHPVNGLYTFGQPRTGDGEFARNFDADMGGRTYRLVHNNDVVPRVPFRAMNYSHVGQFVYFDEEKNLREEMEWWEILMDRIKGRWRDLFDPGTDGIKDHDMEEYMGCLEKAFPAS